MPPSSGADIAHTSSFRTELRAWFKEKDGLARSIFNGSWMLSERVLGMLLALLVNIWVARYLGAEQFGFLNYALAFVAFFTPIASLGVNNILVNDLILDRKREGTLLGSAFALRLIGTTLCIAGCIATAAIVKDPQDQMFWAIVVLAFAHLLNAFDVLGLWFQSKMTVKGLMYWRMGVSIIFSALRVIAILNEAHLFSFVWIAAGEALAIEAANVFAYWTHRQRSQPWHLNFGVIWSLFKRSWPVMLSLVAASIYLKIDQIMLAEMLSLEVSGVYAVAARLSEVWYFIPQILANAIFPSLLKTKIASEIVFLRRMRISLTGFAIAAMSIAVVISISADFIVGKLFGAEFLAAADILRIHIWAGVFVFLRAIVNKWLIAEDHYLLSFLSHALGALLNVVLNLVMIPLWGAIGSAIATLISYMAACYLFTFLARRTWVMGKMMTQAMLWPIFLPVLLLRRNK